MKKAIILAIVSCFLFGSVAFAFEGQSADTSKKSSYTEQLKKKKAKKSKKAASSTTAPAN